MGTKTPKLGVTPEEIEQYKITAAALNRYHDAQPVFSRLANLQTGGTIDGNKINREALINVPVNAAPADTLAFNPTRAYHSAQSEMPNLNTAMDTIGKRITGLQNYADMGRGNATNNLGALANVTANQYDTARSRLRDHLESRDNRRQLLGELAGAGFSYMMKDAGTGANEMDMELRKKMGFLLNKAGFGAKK